MNVWRQVAIELVVDVHPTLVAYCVTSKSGNFVIIGGIKQQWADAFDYSVTLIVTRMDTMVY